MNKKRIIICSVIMALLLSLAGCSGGKIKTSDSAEKILADATEATAKADNLEMNMDMVMTMSAMGTTTDTNMSMHMIAFKDPEKIKMDLSMSMAGYKTTTTSYVERNGDTYITYSKDEEKNWTKEEQDASVYEEMAASITPTAESYVAGMKELEKGEREKLDNGTTTIVVEGLMSADAINNAVNMMGSMDEFQSLGLGSTDVDEDIPLKVWIDTKTGYIAQMEIDMTDYMQAYMNTLFDSLGAGEDYSFDIEEYTMVMEYINYNEAEAFEIPAEVKQAD